MSPASAPRTDAELLAAHRAGEPDAFGELAGRYWRELWAIALRTLDNPHDAADAVQEALVAAYRRAATYRGDAAVRTWLRRIVVNACIDRIRHERVRPTVPLPERELPSPRPDPAVEVATRMAVGEAGHVGGVGDPVRHRLSSRRCPSNPASRARPRAHRLFTVPTGTSRMAAASATG